MLRRYLLRHNEVHFEPTTPLKPSSVLETTYTSGATQSCGLLAKSYARQRAGRQLSSPELATSVSSYASQSIAQESNQDSLSVTAFHSTAISPLPNVEDDRPSHPLRCPTVARLDFMGQHRIGPHSWLTYRIVSLFLTLYSTVLFVVVGMLTYENSYLPLPWP